MKLERKTSKIIFCEIRKRILFFFFLLVLAIGLTVSFCSIANRLDSTGKYAMHKVNRLVNMMKDPDSFKLRNDVLVICESKDGELNHYTYITYSANNSYGASLQKTAIFFNGSYLGSTSDEPEDFKDSDERRNFDIAMINLLSWNMGDASDDWVYAELVSAKK